MVSHIRDYQHVIIDTEGNPTDDDFSDLASNCDMLVIPAVPESVATDGLTHTLSKLQSLGNKTHRVLLTMVPPKPRTDGQQLREMLTREGIPVFISEIPRLAAFEKAAAEGMPVYSIKDDRNASRAWELTKQLGKSSSMAEKRKFAALAELSRQSVDQRADISEEGMPSAPQLAAPGAGQGRGRPATGKRSNPEWKLFSHFLKKKTQREAMVRLMAADNGLNLSDVLQELLENWLKL